LKPWENTSNAKAELDRARQARRSLQKVRLKLLSPTIRALDSSASDLGVAVECLQKLESGLATGQRRAPEWRRSLELEMGGLRRELREVNQLLAGAGKFYEGWARLVSTAADEAPANYTARGTPSSAAPIRSGKVVAIG
jgi:hypothetical protein